MTFDDALTRISQCMDLTPHGVAKAKTFYDLASLAEGPILELGAYRGIGTIALLAAARFPVYCVDDYAERTNWAGGQTGPDAEADLHKALDGLDGWALVRSEVRELARLWSEPAGLILWDLGMRHRMLGDFWAWECHLQRDGIFALRDVDNQALGSDSVIFEALASGHYTDVRAWPGYIWSVKKR